MRRLLRFCLPLLLLSASPLVLAESTALSIAGVKTLKIERGLSAEGKACITCHQQITPGQVADWKDSRHAHAGISCIDCHQNLVHRKVPSQETFKREAWNRMVEEEFGLEPGEAEKLMAEK